MCVSCCDMSDEVVDIARFANASPPTVSALTAHLPSYPTCYAGLERDLESNFKG